MKQPTTTSTGLLLDGIFASEALDSSGEILDIDGLDISDFDEGRGTCNYEHINAEDRQVPPGQEIVGKITFAKKIFKESDCSSEREKMFWNKVKPLPFLYGIVRLYDGAGHEGAKALAAIVRDSHANNEPLVVGFSIEGSTLEKDNKTNRLKSTMARRVAITLRPCNKTAVAALLADPNAPDGYENKVGPDFLAMVPAEKQTKKKEKIDPQFARLGGSEAIYGFEVSKAMTAGNYNAAPGTLTNGAALQVEDRTLRARGLAALRDWNRVTPFKKFLKARMPEVSDDFIDHFDGIVQEHIFRVKKAEEVLSNLRKAGKTPAKPQAPKSDKLTIRGQPVKGKSANIDFDEEKGVLKTPRGNFPMYIPSKHDPDKGVAYNQLLNSPEVSKYHDTAMENFVHAHRMFKAGQVPREMLTHAVMFSQLSPNTPVPVQEMMYGHLVDAMKDTGVSPSSPSGSVVSVPSPTGKENEMHESNAELLRNWVSRDLPDRLPEHSPAHFQRLKEALTLGSDSKLTGRKAGDFMGFQIAHNKFSNISKINQFVDDVNGLITKHKNGRQVSEILLDHKLKAGLHDARRERQLAQGNDIGPYQGPVVAGLAPKTLRYALGMLGAGDVQVPDTHHVRHIFGLDRKLDSNTIDYIKSILWDEKHGPRVLAGMDRHYAQSHDAVRHMLDHPKWGQYFQNPEDAIFPAFWKGWTAIVPHEKMRGLSSSGFNEGTDHLPYWDAVRQYFKSEQPYNPDLTYYTAVQHHRWVQDYGPMEATNLYYQHLVPLLLQNEAKRSQVLMRKFQEIQIDSVLMLAKASKYKKDDNESFSEAAKEPSEEYSPVPLFNELPASKSVLSATPSLQKRQKSKELGLKGGILSGGGSRKDTSFWTKGSDSQHYYAKTTPKWGDEDFELPEPRQEAIYHNLAHEYFGLGEHLPPVALVKRHRDGKEFALIKGVEGQNSVGSDEERKTIQHLYATGTLSKMTLMNHIMGNNDRHGGNFLIHPEENKLYLIDHNLIFKDPHYTPEYLDALGEDSMNSAFHPEALKWLNSLDNQKLDNLLSKYSVPVSYRHGVQERLRYAKANAAEAPSMWHYWMKTAGRI
jgi:hypothetical protein